MEYDALYACDLRMGLMTIPLLNGVMGLLQN
jgi:hypothetical protein